MTKYLLSALAAVMLLVSGAAHAASFTRLGLIGSIDGAHTITLKSGQVLTLPDRFDASKFAVGRMVRFTFEAKNGQDVVSRIRSTN